MKYIRSHYEVNISKDKAELFEEIVSVKWLAMTVTRIQFIPRQE